jgi:hypothetical protein
MKAEPRRAVPMKLQRDKALELCADLMRKLGMVPVDAKVEFDLDHDPALGLRDVDPATGHHVPHQHEPSCLIWRPKARHTEKTRGRGATTAGSDVGEMRKTRQLVRARVERGEVAPEDPAIAPWAPDLRRPGPPKKAWPKRAFPAGRKLESRKPDRRPSR